MAAMHASRSRASRSVPAASSTRSLRPATLAESHARPSPPRPSATATSSRRFVSSPPSLPRPVYCSTARHCARDPQGEAGSCRSSNHRRCQRPRMPEPRWESHPHQTHASWPFRQEEVMEELSLRWAEICSCRHLRLTSAVSVILSCSGLTVFG